MAAASLKPSASEELPMDRILGTIFGNCVGDAIGLLTEFMNKEEANGWFGEYEELEFVHKDDLDIPGVMRHQSRWKTGDWTDDSDQMILILQSILDKKGKVVAVDFAKKMHEWAMRGFPELGDQGGLGIGMTTYRVLTDGRFHSHPHLAAKQVWEDSGKFLAPNGAVMRTSILGIHRYKDIEKVIANTLEICRTTHADPRCAASCVAVTTAIAMMLESNDRINIDDIVKKSYAHAKKQLKGKDEKKELKNYMEIGELKDLKLDENGKIGYTYKCLGAAFWALRQDDFRKALTEIVREAGDADTNGAVAGALLGCKLGYNKLPPSWRDKLLHRKWLQLKIEKFCELSFPGFVQHLPWAEDEMDAGETKKKKKKGKGRPGTAEADGKSETLISANEDATGVEDKDRADEGRVEEVKSATVKSHDAEVVGMETGVGDNEGHGRREAEYVEAAGETAHVAAGESCMDVKEGDKLEEGGSEEEKAEIKKVIPEGAPTSPVKPEADETDEPMEVDETPDSKYAGSGGEEKEEAGGDRQDVASAAETAPNVKDAEDVHETEGKKDEEHSGSAGGSETPKEGRVEKTGEGSVSTGSRQDDGTAEKEKEEPSSSSPSRVQPVVDSTEQPDVNGGQNPTEVTMTPSNDAKD